MNTTTSNTTANTNNDGMKPLHLPKRVNSFQVNVSASGLVTHIVDCDWQSLIETLAKAAGKLGVIDTGVDQGCFNSTRKVLVPAHWSIAASGVSPYQMLLQDGSGQVLAKLFYKAHEGGEQIQLVIRPVNGEVVPVSRAA